MSTKSSNRRKTHHRRRLNKNGTCRFSKTPRSSTATFMGLQHWFVNMYERLGWIVLAHSKGYTEKVVSYQKALCRLEDEIKIKIRDVHSPDHRKDLEIMLGDVIVLKKHANKDFRFL